MAMLQPENHHKLSLAQKGEVVVRVVVGLSGHRLLAERVNIIASVDLAFQRISEAFSIQALTILSQLASRADQLVALRVLMRLGGDLIALLPMPLTRYQEDFALADWERFLELLGQSSQTIAMSPAQTREQAYSAAGIYIAEHCDVLVAIWDGGLPLGQGGTGEIVDCTRKRGLPLAWIEAANQARLVDAVPSPDVIVGVAI
jgi:hypothetical protein